MSDNLKTAEQVRGFIAEVVEHSIGEKLDEMQKENQAQIEKIRAELAAERAKNVKDKKGIGAARFLRTFAAAGGNRDRALDIAHRSGDDMIVKAMEATDATSGGVWVPEELSREVIELLRPASAVRRMNPRTIPMPTGSMSMTKITGGATATYIGEGQNIATTDQDTGKISLNWKKLACLLPISNDLLRFEAFAGDEMIRDDAVAGLAQRADLAFISGDGTEHTPKGLYHMAKSANVFDATSTVNLTNVTSDLAEAILKMRNANGRMLNVGWLWAPTTEMYLKFVRDSNGNLVWNDEMNQGTFLGFPYASTTQIPYTLGSGSNESKVYLVDFADILIGEASTLEVQASSEAAYHNGSSVVAAFSLDQTVLRLIEHHDIATRHEESIVVIEATKWNP
jgi:HK97 family phage major capsid protein